MAIKISGTTVIDDSRNTNTGILTATSAIVGSAVTIRATGIAAGAGIITATEFDITNSSNTFNATGVNVTGIITATSVLVGTGVTISAGIVSATSFRGDGSLLTGVSAGGGAASDITGNLFF